VIQTICDRCGTAGDVVRILEADVGVTCCLPKLRNWLAETMPRVVVVGNVRNRLQQALHVLSRRPTVTAAEIAAENDEPTRKAYIGLQAISRAGKLRHVGRGVFALPEKEAAE
jgi:hypothetical protein